MNEAYLSSLARYSREIMYSYKFLGCMKTIDEEFVDRANLIMSATARPTKRVRTRCHEDAQSRLSRAGSSQIIYAIHEKMFSNAKTTQHIANP